ncbi:YdeI/OmpD-associated family protein [Lacimicrobium alkaliphilum]|uniref:DUF1905 domain-containing protein n=1 Tax=Lacimicrobium alkaliphilum TaxID=1526571 RepID=A0A0U2Z885_9ALTE|nr:YdeI/OmpD-associated family protein [Lacimicrobium alkaliphilum]ALS98660.1 hypothetical protein AT746_10530 [Lacimicrobium alkaliphilum]
MTESDGKSQFTARLLRPNDSGGGCPWAFVVLPKEASAKLLRRGRTTVSVTMNCHQFEALLEPDGRKSHWLRIDDAELRAAKAEIGQEIQFKIAAMAQEPEPEVPADFAQALESEPEAQTTWNATTTIARIDWVHWIVSAKQAKTREKRINDACEMLTSGKKRVCCFDPSGFYSKEFSAPQADESTN